MSLKKILIVIIALFLGAFSIVAIYFFNEEKFYSEYWFQRQVDKSTNLSISTQGERSEVIKYKFYFDPSIDIEIDLDDEGNMLIKRNSWLANQKDFKVRYLKVDKNEFKILKTEFAEHWKESVTTDADFKFGGTYYVIELTFLNPMGQTISIGYYNVSPDESFMDFKNKIITIAKRELKK